MKYGCIAKVLGHSYSPAIHSFLAGDDYELCELDETELADFFAKRDFLGINVTIPYKEAVIPFLDEIDEDAGRIGAVNTIVNRNGKLFGFNTDLFGLKSLIKKSGIPIDGKRVFILGTGGTSCCALDVAESLNAAEVYRVSRTEREGAISYEKLYTDFSAGDIIINTTPVGMYPHTDETPIDLSRLPKPGGMIDAIYNPIRSRLVTEAQDRGIPAVGGLYMLVMQGVRASEIFHGTRYQSRIGDEVMTELRLRKENIILIGMPTSGKTTVGKILARSMGRKLMDSDKEITARFGKRPEQIIAEEGEPAFREKEAAVLRDLAKESGCIIATGGGAILNRETVRLLKQNGRIYFLDRPLEALMPSDRRPLSSSPEAIAKRYHERYGLYLHAADVRIPAVSGLSDNVRKIKRDFYK